MHKAKTVDRVFFSFFGGEVRSSTRMKFGKGNARTALLASEVTCGPENEVYSEISHVNKA